MTFDDQLKRTFDTLSERLREEVDRQVAAVKDELAASARADVERATEEARDAGSRQASGALDAAVADAREQAHAAGLAAGRAEGREEGVREGLEAGRRQGLDEGREQGIQEGREQGLLEGREQGILEGRQQGVQHAREQAEEEGRVALAAAHAERPPAVETGGAERLAGAIGSISRARSLSEILDTLRNCANRESAQADVWLVRGAQLQKWRGGDHDGQRAVEDAGTIADAVRSGTAVVAGREVAVPITVAGQIVAVLAASGDDATTANAAALDVLTQYAARCVEALTAFKAARAVTDRAGATGHDAIAEEDAAARRYARLLVSEIKLYHEPAVIEGRRDRDLATRLGGEIARARALYEERVPVGVRQRADYFRDELVRTLADGDATLLQLT
jgi:hypothetical protein